MYLELGGRGVALVNKGAIAGYWRFQELGHGPIWFGGARAVYLNRSGLISWTTLWQSTTLQYGKFVIYGSLHVQRLLVKMTVRS